MITEDYVSFEVAKLLKEKGFDLFLTFGWSESDKNPRLFIEDEGRGGWYDTKNKWISCSTHQMAMKWLREKHNTFIEICADKALNFKDIIFRPAIYDKNLCCLWESDNYPTYEDAVEAALKYSLENLI